MIQYFQGFGMKSKDVADGKLVIFPRGHKPNDEETAARYRFTHGTYDPGEAYNRGYKWPEEILSNPDFKFGVTEKDAGGEKGGVKSRGIYL